MADEGIRADLGAAPLFAELAPDLLERLAELAEPVRIGHDTEIFHEGEAADRCWLIHDGRVALEVHSPGDGAIVIATLGPGQVLGWSWLYPPYRWHLDARTVSDVVAYEWDGAVLRAECNSDSRLGNELMRRFAQVTIERLQATRRQLLDVYGSGRQPQQSTGPDPDGDVAI